MPADSRDMVLVPETPTEEMFDAGDEAFWRALKAQRDENKRAGRAPDAGYASGPIVEAIWSAMLSASPARGEGDAPPHGYLVKDFADGWFWTRDASLACADGAAVWSLQHGRYETSTRPTPATPAGWIVSNANGDRWRTWEGGFSAWTDDREKATRYARREDAEAVHAEDEDAWRIEPYGPATPAGEELREICQRIADDYQTSETHHPDHVLIRKEHFDTMVAALSSATPEGLRLALSRVRDWIRFDLPPGTPAATTMLGVVNDALQPQAEGE